MAHVCTGTRQEIPRRLGRTPAEAVCPTWFQMHQGARMIR